MADRNQQVIARAIGVRDPHFDDVTRRIAARIDKLFSVGRKTETPIGVTYQLLYLSTYSWHPAQVAEHWVALLGADEKMKSPLGENARPRSSGLWRKQPHLVARAHVSHPETLISPSRKA